MGLKESLNDNCWKLVQKLIALVVVQLIVVFEFMQGHTARREGSEE